MKLPVLLLLPLALFINVSFANPSKDCKPQDLLKDQAIDLNNYLGKVVYIDFWASWCEPCRASFPFLNKLQARHSADQFAVLGISLDEKKPDAEKFLANIPATFPVAIDSSGQCANAFGVQGMPSSFIIGTKGKVIYSHQGFRKSDHKKLAKVVEKILESGNP
jgi:cytochrome c biogenesis protein CcmG, thiol:disulfide interchange protein DsbE